LQQFVAICLVSQIGILLHTISMKVMSAADLLKEELANRQRKNPAYSLRSFAQMLGLDAGTLSNILAAKRPIPKHKLKSIVSRLALPPHRAALLEGSPAKQGLSRLSRMKLRQTTPLVLGDTHHKVLSEWEHFALLSLLETQDFQSSISWIAKRLSISKFRAEQVLKRLEKVKLVDRDSNGTIHKNFERLTTPEDVVSAALQASHRDNLELASSKLECIAPEERDFSSITMAIDPKRIADAKGLIREFRKKLSALMEEGERKAVYRLSIQLFPLTDESKNLEEVKTK
jgi:uncharacterized protein (TIGR02147 family)